MIYEKKARSKINFDSTLKVNELSNTILNKNMDGNSVLDINNK